ncbi:MAG: hypothetical protein ABI151_10125, partial [Chitinophagaceae bacterium]
MMGNYIIYKISDRLGTGKMQKKGCQVRQPFIRVNLSAYSLIIFNRKFFLLLSLTEREYTPFNHP